MGVWSTTRNIGLVLFRVLSVYALIRGLDNLSYNLLVYSSEVEKYPFERLVQLLGSTVVMLVSGIVLWIVAPSIAALAQKDSITEQEAPFSLNEGLSRTVFCAVGLYVLLDTIPIAIYQMGHTIVLFCTPYKGAGFAVAESIIVLGTSIVKFLLGIWLIGGSRKLVEMVSRTMRNDRK